MTLEAGTLLGPYEIVELRGKGGMGEVYRARDTRLDRDVAIKVLPAELTDDETYRKRLEREAKTISQLQHPNVCTLYDVGSQDDVSYLVMEYLEGKTLEDRLRQGALPVDDVLRIGSEIAEAVEAAHRAGVVHRDLKPGNVMLTKTGTKVLDFGLAREVTSPGDVVDTQAATVPAITREGAVVGTMPYMAPEQLQGGQADARTDMWALGCILYEMVTGDRPFGGHTQASLIGAILKDDPVAPSRKQPLSPERLDHIVKRCLEKDPERRWQSARDLTLEFESFDEGVKPTFRMDGRFLSWLAAAAILVLLAGGGAWWLLSRQPGAGEITRAEMDVRGYAVFPFENLTAEEKLDQVAIGIGQGIIADEAIGGGLWKAIAATTPLANTEEPCERAKELEVAFVLEGTIRRVADHLKVATQLTHCPAGNVIWRNFYDYDDNDLFAVEEDVARLIRFGTQQVMNNARYYVNPGSVSWHIGRRKRENNAEARELIREGWESLSSPQEGLWRCPGSADSLWLSVLS